MSNENNVLTCGQCKWVTKVLHDRGALINSTQNLRRLTTHDARTLLTKFYAEML